MSGTAATSIIGRVRLSTQTDERLLARAQDGDTRCFEEVYRRYRSAVFGYCLMRTANRQAAEDATQEVFLKLSEASGATVQNVKAWLFTVARNVMVDASRRKCETPASPELESTLDSVASAADETAFSALDVTTNVYIALRRLPTQERQALIFREFRDWPSQRIADEFKMRPSNVDVLICRARADFGRAYAEVADLPLACRRATETIYRELASGASDRGLQLMRGHLAICPRCQAEYRRSRSPRFLGGFVPWLWIGTQMGRLGDFGTRIRVGSETAVSQLNQHVLPTWSAPAKATVALAIAATALAPGVARYVATEPAGAQRPAATAREVQSPSRTSSGAGGANDAQHSGVVGSDTARRGELLHECPSAATADSGTVHHAESAAHEAAAVTHHAASTTTEHSTAGTGAGTSHTTAPDTVTHTSEAVHTVAPVAPVEPDVPHDGIDGGHE